MVRVVWCVPCLQPLILPWRRLTWGDLWKISADRNVKRVISSACHDFSSYIAYACFWLTRWNGPVVVFAPLFVCTLWCHCFWHLSFHVWRAYRYLALPSVWKKVNNIVLRVFLSKRYEILTITEFFWVGACCPRSDIICQCCSRNYLQLFEQKYLNRFLNKAFYYKMNASLLGSDLWGNLFSHL
jgi:hypothetical protein